METSRPDSHFRPAPGLTAPPASAGGEPPSSAPRLPVSASRGLLGVLIALAVATGFYLALAIAFSAAGVNDLKDNKALTFIATFGQDIALVGTAIALVADRARPTPAMFGFRRCRLWPAVGWTLLAFFAYLVFADIYSQLVHAPKENLPDQLGANDSTLLAVIFGVFAIAIAPPVEEFFFRGFLFQALRNSWGSLLGTLGSAVVFSAIHFAPDKFVQLAILGVALAFIFQKTDSIWPCIALHAINNTVAFALTV